MKDETPIETVERLAALSRIQIPEGEKEALAEEFKSILSYIAQLDELTLDLSGAPVVPPLHNSFRDDRDAYESGTWKEEIVSAFPARNGDSLSVKKIIQND
jgi:aspartyl/glutamyl-tRNA(Asn/Gln) amidotransferase C subunit